MTSWFLEAKRSKLILFDLLDGEYDEETIHFGVSYMWKLPHGKG